MKKKFLLLLLFVTFAIVDRADDFVDDIYFQRKRAVKEQIKSDKPLTPSYNKKVKEIVFIVDTTTTQYPDTVRAIIKY